MGTMDNPKIQSAFFSYLLALGDDHLILGHRISEWCGHGPTLEEDIALTNLALDEIGQANALLALAGEVENNGRDQDKLAYFRDEIAFRNVLMNELPKGDFAFTMVRQLLFSAFALLRFETLESSAHPTLAGIASKGVKETSYHLRHSGEWIIRLGGGTDESRERTQNALRQLWTYTGEFFEDLPENDVLVKSGLMANHSVLADPWRDRISQILSRADLAMPNQNQYMATGGRIGKHTEHLGHLLAEMQILPRSHPSAVW